jgi:hypothetical protein
MRQLPEVAGVQLKGGNAGEVTGGYERRCGELPFILVVAKIS